MPRSLVSLCLFLVALTIAVTAVLMYSQPYSKAVGAIHTIFGIALLLALIWHLRNNFKPLLGYFSNSHRHFWYNLGLAVLLLFGTWMALPPFSNIVEFGERLRLANSIEPGRYDVLETLVHRDEGAPITLMVRAGEHYTSEPISVMGGLITFVTVPQMAVWVEDEQGNFLDTLYISSKAADSSYLTVNPFSEEVVRRPEALPVWSHRRGIVAADGLLMPGPGAPMDDARTAATPVGDYDLISRLPEGGGELVVFLEVNRSFDYNETWHPDAFPDDPVYSGGGNNGQPSLVYRAKLGDPRRWSERRQLPLQLVGRGHHSGADGELYPVEGMTTALQLLDLALLDLRPQ